MVMHQARTIGRLGLVLLAVGGASQALPPGGPPDPDPPQIVRITPGNNAIGIRPKAVELVFDEVVSETPGGGGRDLKDLVFISPKSGDPRVRWSRSRLSIRPSKGWKPNAVYSVVIKPGIQDLRNNRIDTTIRVVFSTGGPIPDTRIDGVAFDWPAGKGLTEGVVEAVAPDSTTYQVATDSAGRFELRYVPPGPYLLRAFADRNTNRELEPLELWDTTRVTLVATARAEFYAFGHDTVGLRISELAVQDSNRVLKVTFDKPYSPEQLFSLEGVQVKRPDSSLVRLRRVQSAAQKMLADSQAVRAKADSAARESAADQAKRDTTPAMRARTDSIARVRRADSVAAADKTRREQLAQLAKSRGGRLLPQDTLPPPKMNRPAVYSELFITFDSALTPATQYRVQVAGVRSLSNIVKSPSRTFSTAKPAKKDTVAQRDSVVRRDTLSKRDSLAKRDSVPRKPPR